MSKIRVAWICSFSNSTVRNNIDLKVPFWYKMIRVLKGKGAGYDISDFAIWNTNAVVEFEKISDVELHVVFTHPMMKEQQQCFTNNGVFYYAINSGDNDLYTFVGNHIRKRQSFRKTWNRIVGAIKGIQPDIIHVMGAENPCYSLSVLSLPHNIPIIVQLQTVLHNPSAEKHWSAPISQKKSEELVLQRADFIGTDLEAYIRLVKANIKKDALFVRTSLIMAERKELPAYNNKQFDFVYFSNHLSKAIDLVIGAFSIAHKQIPSLTLDIIGGCSESELESLLKDLEKNNIKEAVTVEGKLPTHDDVINQICKAKYALLPLKIDLVSSTIREAMWVGLPVLTTITQGTPQLNTNRESVMLSEIGDDEALAKNMLMIVNNDELATRLRNNALITVEEQYGNNASRANEWLETYYSCISFFKK